MKVAGSYDVFETAHQTTPPTSHPVRPHHCENLKSQRGDCLYNKPIQGILTQYRMSPNRDNTIYHVLTATFFMQKITD
jgi:hypothetical protein